MTEREAEKIIREFDDRENSSEEDVFMFTEAMEFLIDKRKDPRLMMHLGGYYYGIRHFDLALKYYEMAAAIDDDEANECLGYIWYYGRTGQKDYEKAFKYFSAAAKNGNIVAEYKIADMYKNGYYVQQDKEKYKEIIRKLYPHVRRSTNLGAPLPEIYTRLAKIESEEGNTEKAIDLYYDAMDFLAQRIKYNPFFGNLNIMKWLIEDLYKLTDPDDTDIRFYDLYYYLARPNRMSFMYDNRTYHVECVEEDGENAICFEQKWFRNVDEFFKKAEIKGRLLTDLYFDLYGFEKE